MGKKNKYIGVSLLFSCREEDKLEAILESYVLKSKKKDKVIADANQLGKERSQVYKQKENVNIDFLGVEDIFQVIGPISEGALLGRTTIWDQTLKEAYEFKTSEEELTFLEQINDFQGSLFLASIIYHVQVDTIPEQNRVIIVNCLIIPTNYSKVVERAFDTANSEFFKKKIVDCDYEKLSIDQLNFIGFEDILVIYDDFLNGGAFQKLSNVIDNEQELAEMLITDDELNGFFEEN